MTFLRTEVELLAAIVEHPEWVAETLGRISRFNGQHPTSNVLLHSLDVYDRLDDACHYRRELLVWSLLHDAHEILSGDVSRTWKSGRMQDQQDAIDHYLMHHLGLDLDADEIEAVHAADVASGDEEREAWGAMIYPIVAQPANYWTVIVRGWVNRRD